MVTKHIQPHLIGCPLSASPPPNVVSLTAHMLVPVSVPMPVIVICQAVAEANLHTFNQHRQHQPLPPIFPSRQDTPDAQKTYNQNPSPDRRTKHHKISLDLLLSRTTPQR